MKTYPAPSRTREEADKERSAAVAKTTQQVRNSLFANVSKRADAESPITLEVSSSFISSDQAHPVNKSLSSANKVRSEEMSIQVKEG